ncbi:hypothetical protein IWZ03DRAFT_113515 [Phyllosticta citriasiana]|uniref:Uncharacterized protein n=1 Tax=Phyllosticta citriasiana TaxID=595635 RepID=A0ABR1KYB9_9PEZI
MLQVHHRSHSSFHHARRALAAADIHPAQAVVDNTVTRSAPNASLPTVKSLFARAIDLTRRASGGSSDDSSSCHTSQDADTCQKPTNSSTAIILAALIPIAIAILVLVFLHRRHVKKQALEDLNDKHKSLDFGLDAPSAPSGKSKRPEMSTADAEKEIRKGGRGLSLDMNNSPYLMPNGFQSSRNSLESMSRSIDGYDPYRPVTFIKEDVKMDAMSTYSKSSVGTDRMGLLKNAQRMSRTYPMRSATSSPEDSKIPEILFPEPTHTRPPPSPLTPSDDRDPMDLVQEDLFGADQKRRSPTDSKRTSVQEPSLPQIAEDHTVEAKSPPPVPPPRKPTPLRLESMTATVHNTDSIISKSSDYEDPFKVTPPSPPRDALPALPTFNVEESAPVKNPRQSLMVQAPGASASRLSVSLRPLPPAPEDGTENPEERANRIRSFYKEYFDDSKPEPQGRFADAHEDYDQEYMEGTVFDPQKGHFVVAGAPFAEPVTRRAMTPPPRAPPRFRGHGPSGGSIGGSSFGGSSFGGRPGTPGSMRMGASATSMGFRNDDMPGPKKPLPPPAPLSTLPTPAALKDDSHIFNPIDFAPPPSMRDLAAGRRPQSPMGEQRPYSPSVRPFTPLASSFDEIGAIPSPHALRKSGTFTSLDFAPVPRLRGPDMGGSDTASVRSGGSSMSAAKLHAVRNGAYRVSRIPKEMVTTQDDLMSQLKPSWDLGYSNGKGASKDF